MSGATKGQEADTRPAGHILEVIRRELQASEAKSATEMKRLQEEVSLAVEKSDKMSQLAIERLSKQAADQECAQSKLITRVSQLHATLRAQCDKIESQQSSDGTTESRYLEFKLQLEAKLRQKFTDVELQQQELLSKCRTMQATCEEVQTYLSTSVTKLANSCQELRWRADGLQQTLNTQQDRIQTLEHCQLFQSSSKRPDTPSESEKQRDPTSHAKIWQIDQQLMDMQKKLDRLCDEAHGDEGWVSRLHVHETRIKGMQAKIANRGNAFARGQNAERPLGTPEPDMEKSPLSNSSREQECNARLCHLEQQVMDIASKVDGQRDDSHSRHPKVETRSVGHFMRSLCHPARA